MNGYGKSDRPVVPAKPPNKTAVAEVAEERGLAKGNAASETRPGRSAGHDVPNGLDRVRRIAATDKEARFTALMHHVSLERLWMAYRDLSPKASPGVDGVMWEDYGQDLVANLRDLHDRVDVAVEDVQGRGQERHPDREHHEQQEKDRREQAPRPEADAVVRHQGAENEEPAA